MQEVGPTGVAPEEKWLIPVVPQAPFLFVPSCVVVEIVVLTF